MKALNKAFTSARLLLAFALSGILGLVSLLAADITILYGNLAKEGSDTYGADLARDIWNQTMLSIDCDNYNQQHPDGDTYLFDTFNSLAEGNQKADFHTAEGADVHIVAHGVHGTTDTITINGVDIKTSDFNGDSVTDLHHCYQDDGQTTTNCTEVFKKIVNSYKE